MHWWITGRKLMVPAIMMLLAINEIVLANHNDKKVSSMSTFKTSVHILFSYCTTNTMTYQKAQLNSADGFIHHHPVSIPGQQNHCDSSPAMNVISLLLFLPNKEDSEHKSTSYVMSMLTAKSIDNGSSFPKEELLTLGT